MAKFRLTKTELRKQRYSLRRFTQYLPILQLKKQQLQMEVGKLQRAAEAEKENAERLTRDLDGWVAVFGEDVKIEELLKVEKVITEVGNIAGVDIPVFRDVKFAEKEYNLTRTPLWVDQGIEALKAMIVSRIKIDILSKQIALLREELTVTTQRVNLFEKIKIPEARERIRKIQIFLGDLSTAAVVTGKIAKEKIHKKSLAVEA